MSCLSDISIVIPTRGYLRGEVLAALPLRDVTVKIRVDHGEGQTEIRRCLTEECDSNLVFLLDDDIELPPNSLEMMMKHLVDGGFDAVCGEVVPVALNSFSNQVLQWKINASVFYPTGITLWRRERLLEVFKALPVGTNNLVGDVAMNDVVRMRRMKVCKIPLGAKHLADTNPLKFFRYRFLCGVSIGLYARSNGGLAKLIINFAGGVPLSRSSGMLIYRSATLLGILASLVGMRNEKKKGGR